MQLIQTEDVAPAYRRTVFIFWYLKTCVIFWPFNIYINFKKYLLRVIDIKVSMSISKLIILRLKLIHTYHDIALGIGPFSVSNQNKPYM